LPRNFFKLVGKARFDSVITEASST